MMKTTLIVKSTGCGGCALAVQGDHDKTAGVVTTPVDHKSGTASVFYDRVKPDTESLLRAV